MKKKQIGIRIMFIAATTCAVFYGYNIILNHTVEAVKITTKETVVTHNEEMTNNVSEKIEALLSELNTKVDSINVENEKLRKVVKEQGIEIEKLNKALGKLGITFQ